MFIHYQVGCILSGRVNHIPGHNIIVLKYQYPDVVFSHPCNSVVVFSAFPCGKTTDMVGTWMADHLPGIQGHDNFQGAQ